MKTISPLQQLALILVGTIAGVALVVSCHAAGSAHAAPTDCTAWEVGYLDGQPVTGVDQPVKLPAGWEPVTVYGGTALGTADIYVTRCTP